METENLELKSAEERKKIAEAAGVDLSKDLVCTCGTGITASVLYSAIEDICQGKLALYDGSWAEYNSKNK